MSTKKDILINIVFTGVRSISLIIALGVADAMLMPYYLGFVLLFRREGVLLANIVQLGLSQSIKYFYLHSTNSEEKNVTWMVHANWLLVSCLTFFFLAIVVPSVAAAPFIGTTDLAYTSLFACYVCGIALGYMGGSSYVSELKFIQYNIIELANGSLIFLVCLLCFSSIGGGYVIWGLGLGTLVFGCGALFRFMSEQKIGPLFRTWKSRHGSELWSYSASRGVSSFLDAATLAVGPWVLKETPTQAGHLILAYTVIRLAQALVMPVAQVIAIRSVRAYVHGNRENVRVILLGLCSIAGGLMAVLAFKLYGDSAVNLWLDNSADHVFAIVSQLIYLVPGVCLFYSIRNYIELRYAVPWNMIMFIVSVLFFFCFYLSDVSKTMEAAIQGTQAMYGCMSLYAVAFMVRFIFEQYRSRL